MDKIMNKKKAAVKIGIVGIGHWGKNILRNLYELGVLDSACDSNPGILKRRKREFPGVNYTSRFDDILKDKKIKAVVISTPSATHYRLAKKAFESGKDVFVEKPLALNLDEGKRLVDMARERKRILMVGHILRYHPAVIKLKGLIKDGRLGKIQYIYSNRLNIGRLKAEENILWSFAPHDISAILMLLGQSPVKVGCFGADYLSKGIYDVTINTLEFKDAVKAHIFVSWLHPFKEQKLIVVGSKAMAVFDDLTKEKLFIYPHRIEWKNKRVPVAYKAEHYSVKVEDKEPLEEEMRHFVKCVLKRETPKTDGKEGLKVLKILEEAEKSMKTKDAATAFLKDKEYSVHPSSYVDKETTIGRGTQIWHFSHVLKGSMIGRNCKIGQNVLIGPDVKIGSGCKIQNNISIYKGVTLEDDVFCGPACVFTNVYNPRAFIERKNEFLPTLIKKGATVGANATVICGVTIGRYAFIGAGAVVKEDVPDHALVIGIPAKEIGYVCRCGVTLKFVTGFATCDYCGSRYTQHKDGIKPIKNLSRSQDKKRVKR